MCGRNSDSVSIEDRSVTTDVDTSVRTESDDISTTEEQGISLSVSNVIDLSNHDNVNGYDPEADEGGDFAELSSPQGIRTTVVHGLDPEDQLPPVPTGLTVQLTNDVVPGPHFSTYQEYVDFRSTVESDYSNMVLGGLGAASVLVIGSVAIGWIIKRILARQARLYPRPPPAYSMSSRDDYFAGERANSNDPNDEALTPRQAGTTFL